MALPTILMGLLRVAPFILCFLGGWHLKGVYVERAELRQETAELKEAKADRDRFEKELKDIRGKYEKLDASNCTRELSDCAGNYIDKLFAQ